MIEVLDEGIEASEDTSYMHEGERRDWFWTAVAAGAGAGGIVSCLLFGRSESVPMSSSAALHSQPVRRP